MSKLSYWIKWLRVKWNLLLIKLGVRKYSLTPRAIYIMEYFKNIAMDIEQPRNQYYEDVLDFYCQEITMLERKEVAAFVSMAMEEISTGRIDQLDKI